jgi:mannosyl-3-phosphoglycerate phosphatase
VQLSLASSRTVSELVVLQRALGIPGPIIAEDGSILAVDTDHSTTKSRTLALRHLGATADDLRREYGHLVHRFELDPADHATMKQLGFRSRASVRRALTERRGSVLLDLSSLNSQDIVQLQTEIEAKRAHLHRGGRWFTLTRDAGKGAAASLLRQVYEASHHPVRVVAIGNEENDASLLSAADFGFAINNPSTGIHPALQAVSGVIPLKTVGTAGFGEMLDRLVDMPFFKEKHE